MPRIALVLGAGGVVGQAFHAGVLKAVNDVTGFDARLADVIVGTSAGSVAAASLRGGVGAADLFARATGRPLSPDARDLLARVPVPAGRPPAPAHTARSGPSSPRLLGRLASRPLSPRPGLALTALLPEGRRDTTGWFAGFDAVFAAGRWPDATMLVCAVDLDQGKRVVFGAPMSPRATVAQAVHASCAIPAVFQPAVIDGVRYVDGGVHSPTNADLVATDDRAFDAVVVSSPMSSYARSLQNGSAASSRAAITAPLDIGSLAQIGAGWSMAQLRMAARFPAARALARERRRLEDRNIPVLVIEPTRPVLEAMGLQPMDFRRRAPVAEAAYEAARAYLEGPDAREVGRTLARAR